MLLLRVFRETEISIDTLNYKDNIRKKSGFNRNKILWRLIMRKEYDFSKAVPNPYAKKLRKQISIRIDADAIDYFKKQSKKTGIPYQQLINLYLLDCVVTKKEMSLRWD